MTKNERKNDDKVRNKRFSIKKAEFTDWKAIYKNLWMHEESARYMLWTPTKTEEDAKARMFRTSYLYVGDDENEELLENE